MEFKKEIHPELGAMWRFLEPGEEEEAVRIADQIVEKYDLKAEMSQRDHMSRGNQGDAPTYTRIIILSGPKIGPILGPELLAELSTKISNTVPVNKVLFQILDVRKKP